MKTKKSSKERSASAGTGMFFGKKSALDQSTFNDALKCSQNIINQLEDRNREIQRAQIHLEAFKEDFKDVKILNERLIEKMRKVEDEAELKEGRIQKLDNELITLFQESKKLREESEDEKKRSKELEDRAECLECDLEEEKNSKDLVRMELSNRLKEKEIEEAEITKIKDLLSNKEGTIKDLKWKIECFEKEFNIKEQMIQRLNDGMKQQHEDLKANLQNTTTQKQCWIVIQENEELMKKVTHYKQCLNEMKEEFNGREIEYRQRLKMLEKKLKVATANEIQNHQKHQIGSLMQSAFQPVPGRVPVNFPDNNQSHSQEIQSSLNKLSSSEKKRKETLLEMQSKSMSRNEEILHAKYDSSDLARQTRNNRKLNRIAIEKDERRALLTRLNKLEVENQKLAAESKEVFFNMEVCRKQNTELVGKMKNHEEEMNAMNEAEYTREVRREENTKLARRLRVYEEKLKSAGEEIARGEEWKRKYREIEAKNNQIQMKLQTTDNERKAMEQSIADLQKDVEFYRKSSMVVRSTSCCFDLKVGKEKMEKEVNQLQSHISSLENKLRLSRNAEKELESVLNQLKTTENDLNRLVNELEVCKADLKESRQENKMVRREKQNGDGLLKRPIEQPNVNVHVHLDPNQLLGGSAKYHQPTATRKTEQSDSGDKVQDLLDQIRLLTAEKELLKERLNDSACEEERGGEADKELANLKKKNASLLKEKKKIELHKLKLESDLNDLQSRIQEYKISENKMEEQIDELKDRLSEYETSENEMREQVDELEGKLAEYETSETKTQEENEELKQTLKEMKIENKETVQNYKDEILELRHKLKEQSNEDMECLRKKIHDLTMKKEKCESLIEKLKEDKADLQMSMERLQREISGLKEQLHDNEESKGNSQQPQQRAATQRQNSPIPDVNSVKKVDTTSNDIGADDVSNVPEKVVSKKPTKPSWLTPTTLNKAEEIEHEDDFLDIQPKKKNVQQNSVSQKQTPEKSSGGKKKPSTLSWLTSTPKETEDAGNENKNEDDDDDDFLNIRPKKQRQQSSPQMTNTSGVDLSGLLTRLDTSGRRNVPKRNVNNTNNNNKTQQKQKQEQQTTRDVSKSKPKQTVDHAEQFLQNMKPKAKKQDDGSLDFLQLEDDKTRPPVKRQPISTQPRQPKPIRNAEFLIPEI